MSRPIAAASARRITLRHDQTPSRRPRRPTDAAGGRGDQRAFPTPAPRAATLGSPSTLPLSSRTDGTQIDVRGGEQRADASCCRDVAEKPNARLDAAPVSPARAARHRACRRPRSRAPRQARAATASIEILESFLAHQPSGREHQRHSIADAELGAGARCGRAGSGRNRSTSTPYGTVSMRSGVGAERDRAAREIVAARGHVAGASKRLRAPRPRRRERLRDVHVRAVQADDERQRRRRERGSHAAGHHPVAVHDRGAVPPRDRRAALPPRRQRQRRGHVRAPRAGSRRRASPPRIRRRSATAPARSEEMKVDAGPRPAARPAGATARRREPRGRARRRTWAIGSMNVPTLSPGNRGYDVVTITTTCAHGSASAAAQLRVATA